MFNNCIENTVFTDNISNEFFRDKLRVRRTGFRNGTDRTLESTLRAMVYPRIPDGEKMTAEYQDYRQGTFDTDERVANLVRQIQVFFEEDTMAGYSSSLRIFSVAKEDEFNKIYSLIKEDNTWEEVEKIRLFFVKNFNCCSFVNRENKRNVIIFECKRGRDMVVRFYHAIQCVIVNALPWYFENNGIKDLEKELLYAIADGNSEKYLEILNKMCEEVGFKEEAVRKLIASFETKLDNRTKDSLTRNISDIDEDIRTYLRRLEDFVSKKRELEQRLSGLLAGLNNRGNEHALLNMFEEYDCLKFREIVDDDLYFDVNTYLTNWSDAAKQNVLHVLQSSLYNRVREEHRGDLEALLTEVFDTRKIKIKISGAYVVSARARLSGCSGRMPEIPGYMPNPHIYRYNCNGSFAGDIADALARADFAQAIEIAIASAGNVNFEDPTVMSDWGAWMAESLCDGISCFELPDGRCVGYKDAIKWVNEQKGENNE